MVLLKISSLCTLTKLMENNFFLVFKAMIYCEFGRAKGGIIGMLIYNTQGTEKPSKHLNGERICMLVSEDTHILPSNNYKLMHSDIWPNNYENATALIKLFTRTPFLCIKDRCW